MATSHRKESNMSRLAHFTTLCSISLLLLATRTAPAAELYTIDPTHTSVVFSVAHSGLSYTYGFFRKASGMYAIDKTNPANCGFRFLIEAEQLGHEQPGTRRAPPRPRLSSTFNSFPNITFETTKCEAVPTQGGVVYQLTGNLTIHGVARQITIPALRMLGEGPGPRKDHRTGFLCQIELKRSEFGMNNLIKDNLVGDAVGITISFEGKLQEPPAAAPRTQ